MSYKVLAALLVILLGSFTAHPAAAGICGNGIAEVPEECDPGGGTFIQGNPGNPGCTSGGSCFFRFSCCKFNCQFVGNGPACDDGNDCTGNGECRQAEANCTGAVNRNVGAACGNSASSPCTAPDTCNGTGSCLANHTSAGTACGDSDDDQCDDPDTCDGAGSCQSNLEPAGTPAGALCDDGGGCTFDACDGGGGCTHTPVNDGEVCRGAAGSCDVAEVCSNGACPSDAYVAGGTECRGTAGVCDLAEACTGSSPECPLDAFRPASTECRVAAGICDVAEHCSGATADCPSDGFVAGGATCRAGAGPCDVAETCTGSTVDCPSDDVAPPGTECRAAAGDCDVPETCSGGSVTCPGDGFATTSIECRPTAGDCDVAEHCSGLDPTCPGDGFATAGASCRTAAGSCDVAESCTGAGPACPADTLVPAGTTCRAAAGPCDTSETCDGLDGACPLDAKRTTECRTSSGPCDPAELCDGSGDTCPADERSPNGAACDDGNPCTGGGLCDGSGAACATGTPVVCAPCEACDGDGGCAIGPLGICRRVTGKKAKLIIKDRTPDDHRDVLIWKFNKLVDGTEAADFGTPTDPSEAGYHFCLFEDADPEPGITAPVLVSHAAIPAGPPWAVAGAGYRYKLQTPSPKGLRQVGVKAVDGIGKVNLKLKGSQVPLLDLPLGSDVVVHFQSETTCWQARYSVPRVNRMDMFKGLADDLP